MQSLSRKKASLMSLCTSRFHSGNFIKCICFSKDKKQKLHLKIHDVFVVYDINLTAACKLNENDKNENSVSVV